MTDAQLVTVMLSLFGVGGLLGSALTILAYRRRELMQHRDRLRHEEQSDALSYPPPDVLDQLVSRFNSLEERVDFTERVMLDRPSQRGPGPDRE